MAKMPYVPNVLDAVDIYTAAACSLMPPSKVESLTPSQVKQTTNYVFHMMGQTKHDTTLSLVETIAICLYDKWGELWYVRLQDGTIMKVVRDPVNSSYRVTEVLPLHGEKPKLYQYASMST
jgi:hypothetical protein